MNSPLFTIIFLIFFGFITNPSEAQNLEKLQRKTDSLYEAKRYEEATEGYIQLYNNPNIEEKQKPVHAFYTGKSYYRLGKLDESIFWYGKASEGFEKLGNTKHYFVAQGQIASVLDEKGNYIKAIEINEKAVQYFREEQDNDYLISGLNNQALYHYHAGDIHQAIKVYNEVISLSANDYPSQIAIAYNQLGNIWAEDLNDEQKALEYYQKSLQLKLKSQASAKSISFAYSNLGLSYKNLKQSDSAMYYFQLALDYSIQSNEPATQLDPLINIANLQKESGNLDQTIKTYNRALKVSESASLKQRTSLQINLARSYVERKEYSKALQHLLEAEEFIKETKILNDQRDVHALKAIVFAGMGQFHEAYNEQDLASNLTDSIIRRDKNQEITDLMVQYESVQKDNILLDQKQQLQQKELSIKKYTIWFISIVGVSLLLSAFLFYLFKRKEALARETELKLSLSEEKEHNRLQQERLRISRELHDNIGSYLTLINASIEQVPEMNQEEMNTNLPKIKNVLSMGIRELRKTVWLLNKEEVTIDEIALRLRDFFKPLKNNKIKIYAEVNDNEDQKLKGIQATHLFRIIQEAVNNAHKYALANHIEVRISGGDKINFSIIDDGQGFDLSEVASGNGLKNMESRVKELNGELTVNSQKGEGTIIRGSFPN